MSALGGGKSEAASFGDDGWMRWNFTVDSGAAVSCLPAAAAEYFAMNRASGEQQQVFKSASGDSVREIGTCKPKVYFPSGEVGQVNFKILDSLRSPLLSVGAMVDAGYKVAIEPDVAWIESPQGVRTKIYKRRGVYVVPCWLKSDFPGQPAKA